MVLVFQTFFSQRLLVELRRCSAHSTAGIGGNLCGGRDVLCKTFFRKTLRCVVRISRMNCLRYFLTTVSLDYDLFDCGHPLIIRKFTRWIICPETGIPHFVRFILYASNILTCHQWIGDFIIFILFISKPNEQILFELRRLFSRPLNYFPDTSASPNDFNASCYI